jgi:hypothetical protein
MYKTDSAREVGGELRWTNDMDSDPSGSSFLSRMDFSLVHVVLSFDAINSLDMEKLKPLLDTLPPFGPLERILTSLDTRTPESWQPTGPGQVLLRNATAARRDYERLGLMSGTARWVMREADRLGFRDIPIVCLADAMTHVRSNPEPPYRGSVVSKIDMATYRDEERKMPFVPSKQLATRCYVELR